MGYTHYWGVKSMYNQNKWWRAINDCIEICRCPEARKVLAGPEGKGKPSLNGHVLVNGKGPDNDHETFYLPNLVDHGYNERSKFDFCKTARKPYDLIVVACLCALADRMGRGVEVTSDGGASEWTEGAQLASRVLGRTVPIPATVRDRR